MYSLNYVFSVNFVYSVCMYKVSLKKGTLVIFVSFLFHKSDFTFSHMFWNRNLEPVSSSHSRNIHRES